MRTTALPAVAAVALALGACSPNNDEPAPSGTPTSVPTAATSPDPTDTEPTEVGDPEAGPTTEASESPTDELAAPAGAAYSTEEQRSADYPSPAGVDGALLVTGVRAAVHEGFERVVLDLDGTGTPGWSVRYVEEAIADESNQEVDLDGEFILKIDVSGVTPPITDGEVDPERMATGFHDPGPTALVQDVYVSGAFEGWSSALVGLDEQAPFRVFTLTDPTRLVVDISTEPH